jgi:hypothetical protein
MGSAQVWAGHRETEARATATMGKKRIVCVEMVQTSHGHQHIAAVGIAAKKASKVAAEKLTVAEVRAQLASADGDRYFTQDIDTGKKAKVESYSCHEFDTIRSSADSVRGNNLDHLRPCNWKP